MINLIKNKFLLLLNFLVIFLIIFNQFYRFVLRVRVPRALTFEFNWYTIIIGIIIILIHSYVIYLLYKDPEKETTNPIIIKLKSISNSINKFIDTSYERINGYIEKYQVVSGTYYHLAKFYHLLCVHQ